MAAKQSPRRARIIVLAQDKTRCIDLTDDDCVERLDHGFPVEIVPPTEADTPHRDYPLGEHERAEAVKFVFRAIDRALHELELHDQRPLVVVGTERDLSYFAEVARRRTNLVATVRGNHERDTPKELARLVQPALDTHARSLGQVACNEVREALGTHAVAGIAESWAAASEGRGRRLVVEGGYSCVAHIVEGALQPAPDGTPGTVDAIADTVAEVVRHDGEVIVVPAGSLADIGHIALLTRY